MPPIVLASASPRRKELLGLLGVPFVVRANDGEDQDIPASEQLLRCMPPLALEKHPVLLAWRKAVTAAQTEQGIILAADTIVVFEGRVLGKPKDTADAVTMLRQLTGNTHTVHTGVVVLDTIDPHTLHCTLVTSQVTMTRLHADQIEDYVATGEPRDKAGAYGIQGLGGHLIERVEGSYTSVVGLPLKVVESFLHKTGITVPVSAETAFKAWQATLPRKLPGAIV